jgi:hypothetical protein
MMSTALLVESVGRAAAEAAVDPGGGSWMRIGEPVEANCVGGEAPGEAGDAGGAPLFESTRGAGEVFGVKPPGGE